MPQSIRCLSLAAALACAAGVGASASEPGDDPRDTLVTANRILALEGLVGPYGHVSARSTPARFWIADHRSPDSVERDHLKEAEVGLSPAAAQRQNWYREIFIHSEIYRLLPAVGAVVHVHAPYSVALGTLSAADRIRPTTNPGANLGAFVPIFAETGLIETPEKAARMASMLQGQNAVLLRGHGAVIVGATVQQAVLRAVYLEVEARSQLMARAAGTPLFFTPEETGRFRDTSAVEHAWEYYVEKLNRSSGRPVPHSQGDLEQRLLSEDPRRAVARIIEDPESAKSLLDDLREGVDRSVRSHRDAPEQRKVQYSRENLETAIRLAALYRDATGDGVPHRSFVARRLRLEGTALLNARKYQEALSALTPALAEAVTLEDRWLEMTVLTSLAYAHLELGHREEAVHRAEGALAVARSLNHRAQALALYNLAAVHLHLGWTASAIDPLLAAAHLARAAGHDMWLGNTMLNLGVAYRLLAQRVEAERATQEALAALERAGDRLGVGRCLYNLALLAVERGDDAAAANQLEQALPIIRQVDIRHSHEIEEEEASRYNTVEEHALVLLVGAYQRTGESARAEGHQTALDQLRLRKPPPSGHSHVPLPPW